MSVWKPEAGACVLCVRVRAREGPEAGLVSRRPRAMEGRDCGPPSEEPAEEAEFQGAGWSGDSGTVSQSHSSASGPWEDEGPELGAPGRDLPLLRRAAAGYAACLLPGAGARPEVEALDASLEDLLTRVDEFVGMLDMLRGDSSHVVSEGVPRIHAKATEMRQVYSKIDRLEAFVRMIGASVARMEEQVARAEAELGAFPSTFRKLLHTINVPSFFHKAPSSRPQHTGYEPPVLFRTEDHFPCCSERPQV
nr:LOW QUALITY PROTEIN: biogenesis of lysosome-related organelles complex 1 subunit 4 [Equus asinus]